MSLFDQGLPKPREKPLRFLSKPVSKYSWFKSDHSLIYMSNGVLKLGRRETASFWFCYLTGDKSVALALIRELVFSSSP